MFVPPDPAQSQPLCPEPPAGIADPANAPCAIRFSIDDIPVCVVLIDLSVAAYLIALCRLHRSQTRPGRSPLPKWRLKRVVEYVDMNLARCITLQDMAAATGLTRMHFAAQFRLATGIRPHEYVLRQRIARAQEMLRTSDASLVNVALGVGFQTQAHFTTVFKRFTGQTPHRWRKRATCFSG